MFLEADSQTTLSLDGEWHFRLGNGSWRTIRVPAAWEAETGDRLTEGPAVYRRIFALPDLGGRWLLECDGVSFAAKVHVNGRAAGEHLGMWSRWQMDITPLVHPGENELEFEVWKPGRDRYGLRESLAGFLPDVCNTFGGIWQGLRLRQLNGPAIADLRVRASARGVVRVSGRVVGEPEEQRRLPHVVRIDELGVAVPFTPGADGTFDVTFRAGGYVCWSPQTPRLYDLIIEAGACCVGRRVGFCSLRARGERTLLNGRPVHLRGVLDWGWDERRLCPTPSRDEVRDAFAKARNLGFNLFKLCLFVPDGTTFDLADEEGMLLWLELPMWLPRVTPEFKALALREYEAILERVHHHPAVVIVSLGCELSEEVDAAFLSQLRSLARRWLPDVLMCDNSGSGEAYGGPTREGDFYDYHFYTEPHYFPALVAHFERRYLPTKPWIYGEFCDADTQRDWSRLRPVPFWVTGAVTAQRDELTWAREHAQRLQEACITDGGAALTRIGRQQATAVRKFIIEHVRRRYASGGYVVTGWRDTPITTSGVVDDRGEVKFDPGEWRRFNADRVLVMDRERRRRWVHGGDRPVYRDPCCWWDDEPIEVHLILSNGAAPVHGAELRWRLSSDDVELVGGLLPVRRVGVGEVCELGMIRFGPFSARGWRPRELRLGATLSISGADAVENAWSLWSIPSAARGLVLSHEVVRYVADGPLVASVLDRVCSGEWLVLLASPVDWFVLPCPFWRESVHIFVDDLVGLLGLQNGSAYANMRYYGLATDYAVDAARLAKALACDRDLIRPLWRRFDARAMTWLDYLVEVPIGQGGLIVSTLRFGQGAGHQPGDIKDNPMGAWLLTQLTRRCARSRSS